MRIVTKPVVKLTDREYRQVDEANFGYNGMMQDELWRAYDNDDDTVIAVMLKHGHELIGWCLLSPVTTDDEIQHRGTTYTKRRSKYTVMFYVHPENRRQGHGKTLMAAVMELDPRPHVIPHDIKSGEFFANYEVTVTNWDKPHQRRKPKVA